jgi:thioredoxin-like negative regulator of GroEL
MYTGDDLAALEAAVQAKPDDPDARRTLSLGLFAAGAHDQALEHAVKLAIAYPEWEEGAGRDLCVKYFESLGHTHELSIKWVRKLQRALSV